MFMLRRTPVGVLNSLLEIKKLSNKESFQTSQLGIPPCGRTAERMLTKSMLRRTPVGVLNSLLELKKALQ
ncbi:hypothetical protein BCV73_20535 [Paenibacillus sp. SSG-1]|nr:hypothetical protein BCV73_20535 [Paenibacillus sp. SSG-1]